MKVKSESEVTQACPTLSNPMDCSLPGFSVHGIFQARVLEWGAIAFSALLTYCALDVYGPGTFCLLLYTKDGGSGLVVKSCPTTDTYASRTDGRSISSEKYREDFFFKYNFAAYRRLKDLLIRKGLNI